MEVTTIVFHQSSDWIMLHKIKDGRRASLTLKVLVKRIDALQHFETG